MNKFFLSNIQIFLFFVNYTCLLPRSFLYVPPYFGLVPIRSMISGMQEANKAWREMAKKQMRPKNVIWLKIHFHTKNFIMSKTLHNIIMECNAKIFVNHFFKKLYCDLPLESEIKFSKNIPMCPNSHTGN